MLFRIDATFVALVTSPYSKMDRPPTTIIMAVVFCVLSQLRRTSSRALDIETASGFTCSQFRSGVTGFNSSLCAASAPPSAMATIRAADRKADMLLSIVECVPRAPSDEVLVPKADLPRETVGTDPQGLEPGESTALRSPALGLRKAATRSTSMPPVPHLRVRPSASTGAVAGFSRHASSPGRKSPLLPSG